MFSSMKNPYHTAEGFQILEHVENQCPALLLVPSLAVLSNPTHQSKTNSQHTHVLYNALDPCISYKPTKLLSCLIQGRAYLVGDLQTFWGKDRGDDEVTL